MATRTSDRAQMLTAAEAAGALGVKLGTLYAYVSRGWLKSYRRRIGRQALYRRSDIEALRGVVTPERGRRGRSLPDASSWVTVAQPKNSESPAPGVIVAESGVSSIIDGQLAYRGYPIQEIVEHACYEEVCLLLWNGERPSPDEIAALRAAIAGAGMAVEVAAAIETVGPDSPPLLRMAAMLPALAAWDRRQAPRARIDRAKLIVSQLPLALGTHAIGGPANGTGMSARLLLAVAGSSAPDWEVAALDRVLVACAEHELNASTFAARVVASTGADLFASVLAALCSLSGPIHGGACDRIEEMFAQIGGGMKVADCLDAIAREHRLPPGFGHAIYSAGDPRAALLRTHAETLARRKGRKLFEAALKIEEAVWKRDRLRPNLDFYLTVSTRMLGFPRGIPAAIFGIGRAAGWIAHALEQYADNRLIRPRMRYRGAPQRHWI
ncbi:MAG TPA: citrate/2-methylcitrate synthase [Candidatus Binataceae bacterium]|nr:citrate/2-methylcitrate synthase [Candidatus Binataceae bacterium]